MMRFFFPTGSRRARLPGLGRGLLLPGLLWAAAISAAAQAPPPERFALEEVVVTASRFEEEIRETPRHVTVITAADIARATSNFVPELLAREAGVVLRSLFGTDKNAGVDIRGMGETSVSNVLVLVDGFRLNPPDLAGPDFSTIPLEEIERIEIVRGANSVLYGSGAVGGVVNIITKRGAAKPSASLYGSYGSYRTLDGRASGGGTYGNLNLSLNAGYFDTDGYRENGGLNKKDAGLRLRYHATDHFDRGLLQGLLFSLGGGYHADRQGFPGGVPIEDIDSASRRKKTRSPRDGAESEDARLRGGVEADFGPGGLLRLNGGFRSRSSDYLFGYTPLKSKSEQTSTLDEETLHADAGHVLDYRWGPLLNTLQLGAEVTSTDYITERLDQRERKNSALTSYGLFATHRSRLGERWILDLGARANFFRGTYRNDALVDFGGRNRWVNGEKFRRNFDDQAYQAGIVFAPNPSSSLFANLATSFRVPNVDEYALAEPDLQPQHGRHLDLGWRQRYRKWAESSVTLFAFEIEDEIYYDPNLRVSRNFADTTRRVGCELSARVFPVEPLTIWGNYTFTRARFLDGGDPVPLVPEHAADAGLEWRITQDLSAAVLGTFVGKKEDGSSLASRDFARIDAYQVFDLKITYTWHGLRLFGGVNNLFDERYATIAFSESYYPMPTRNFYLGAQFNF